MKLFRKLLKSVKNRHQNNLESIRRSEFAFGYVHLFYNKSHNINPNRGGSYIDFICFQYDVTALLNLEDIKKDLHRITKIKSFLNKYNWKE